LASSWLSVSTSGLNLVGHLAQVQRAEQCDLARADLLAQAMQRLQRAAHRGLDQHAQQQQQQA